MDTPSIFLTFNDAIIRYNHDDMAFDHGHELSETGYDTCLGSGINYGVLSSIWVFLLVSEMAVQRMGAK